MLYRLVRKLLRLIWNVFLGLCGFVAIVVLLFCFDAYYHHLNLKVFVQQVACSTLPQHTAVLEVAGVGGTLAGMGDHVSYGCILVVQSKLSAQQLTEHYTALPLTHAQLISPWGFEPIAVHVLPASSAVLQDSELNNIDPPLTFCSLANIDSFEGYFFVLVVDGTYWCPEGYGPWVLRDW